jgi:hypothetical protein
VLATRTKLHPQAPSVDASAYVGAVQALAAPRVPAFRTVTDTSPRSPGYHDVFIVVEVNVAALPAGASASDTESISSPSCRGSPPQEVTDRSAQTPTSLRFIICLFEPSAVRTKSGQRPNHVERSRGADT